MASTKTMQNRAKAKRQKENRYRQISNAFRAEARDWGFDEKSPFIEQAAKKLGIKLR